VRDAAGTTWLYSRERLADDTFLVIAVPRPRITLLNIIRDDLLPPLFLGGLAALVLSLIFAFLMARWIADPLQQVVLAAREMPSEQARPVDERGPHEVRELTRSFNAMMARVQISQKSQREFVANVSHELKTPLTSIQGFSQAILDGTADLPEQRRKAAQVIYDESARMYRLVLDLLDLARLDGGIADITMSPVSLKDLLNAVAEKFSPQSQKAGVEIRLDVPVNLPAISADGDRLMQVFTNLVDNALKFTPRGGAITLHASQDVKGQMHLSVADNGHGIPPEKQAHIFDRFYQADPARRGGYKHGTGLGLAIAREIIQAHGGKISVRSGPGMGTTFEMFLPLTQNSRTTLAGRK
jgi:signal transduction histidine kinase